MPTLRTTGVLAMTQRGLCPSLDLRKVFSTAQLPALPQSAHPPAGAVAGPGHGPDRTQRPIEADGGLTIQVLRFVNSSYFGFSRRIASVKTAITLVGIRAIRDFALWSGRDLVRPEA